MQIDIVVNGRKEWQTALDAALAQQSIGLGLSVSTRAVTGTVSSTRRSPLVYLLGTSDRVDVTEPSLATAATNRFVLPIAKNAPAAGELPKALRAVNALLCSHFGDAGWPVAAADEILSQLWLARTRLKVFVSYKRSDSEGVADQLHMQLTKRGYDAFRDDCSIARGADFQRELHFWLNDADLILLLVTPDLAESEWVLEEIELAKSAQVGVLAVVWPEAAVLLRKRTKKAQRLREAVDRFLRHDRLSLARTDFRGTGERRRLKEAALQVVIQEALRARNDGLSRRLGHMLPAAREQLAAEGRVRRTRRLGELVVTGKTLETLVWVTPYRPAVDQFWELFARAGARAPPPDAIGFFYGENDPHARSVQALRWAVVGRRAGPNPKTRLLWAFDASRTQP